jgi:hypothetical protein
MTTIITRLYPDAATARGVVSALLARGLDQDLIDVIGADGTGPAEHRLRAASVNPRAAAAFAAAITGGKTAVVVRAPFSPIGTARNALKVMDRTASIHVGVDGTEYIRNSPSVISRDSVMMDHPFFMSNPLRPMSHGHVFGLKLLSAHKERRSAISGGRLMSKAFWPMKHISANKERNSAMRRTWFFSKFLLDMPLITRG